MARNEGRRRRRKPSDVGETSEGIRQLPKKQLVNRFDPIEALTEEQVEIIHNASLKILEEQGIEVLGEMALEVFRKGGADVSADGVVRLGREMVMETIAHAPAEFDVVPRNKGNTIRVGGNAINFGLVSGPLNVHDSIRGRRAGNLEDYSRLVSLGQFFNIIGFFGNQTVATTDLPANTRHLDTIAINLGLSDKPFFTIGIGAGRTLDAVEMAAIVKGMTIEEMKSNPMVMTNINVNSPRKLDDSMAYGAMQLSMLGQPVTVTPFTLMGAMNAVGPGGHFFGCQHTMERYKSAFYEPFLSDWQNNENWLEAGAKDSTMRATELWQQALSEYEEPKLDSAVSEQLDAYIAKRKEQMGTNEPDPEPVAL